MTLLGRTSGPLVVVAALALGAVGVVGVAAAPVAGACSCAMADAADAFESSVAVFSATSMERRDERDGRERGSADPVRYVFEVDRVYKGDVHATQSVVTAASGSSCGLELTGPGPFLVFTHEDPVVDGEPMTPGVLDGELVSGLCSGTRQVTDEQPVPASFGAGTTPTSGSSPIGEPGSGSATWWPWAAGAAGVLVVAGGVVVLGRRRRRGTS